ncbi:hypothetical protein [Kangiella sediminilitoris]|uniref:PilZ domain-containing protein n=1 Tax=Kangiella sediminilitoris TaxID=1144748 RepID=A0A1B3B904_9GAMM|nr:hypothetical protein [Kangiella sediminilitoris]AOE49284.1 hypothetical protein KS2013_560 [Kangiella sediminilitoris]
MALTQGSLGLTTRVQNKNVVPDIPSTIKEAKHWIEMLPVADMGETASKIFHYLYDLNQSPLEPKNRLQILESVKPTCLNILNSLATVYIHSPLKYSQKLQSASELVHAISSEIVFGFNTVIEDLCSNPADLEKYQKTILPAACANSLQFQGYIQLQRYQLYKTVGSKLWVQQNIIFKLSLKYELLEHKLRKDSAPLGSIKKQLLINLMLPVSAPYQLKHGEINEVYNSLETLADLAEIRLDGTHGCLFAYLPDSDIAPQPANSIEEDDQTVIGLDLQEPTKALEQNLKNESQGFFSRFKKKAPDFELEPDLIEHLITHWSKILNRNFIRMNSKASTQVCVGLAASHHFLIEKLGKDVQERFFGGKKTKTRNLEPQSLELDQDEGDSQHSFVWKTRGNVTGLTGEESKDAFASIYKPPTKADKQHTKEDKPFKNITTKTNYQWTSGVVRDVSPAGFCLAFEKAPSTHAEANELITVKNIKDHKEQYNLGMIRWNRWHKSSLFLIGVETIAPQAIPVRVTLDWDYAKPAYHHNGLLLPEMPNVGIDATIILPPLGYRSGQTVAIMTPEDEFKLELNRKVIETDNFIQFRFRKR